jgi:hypothetical protein
MYASYSGRDLILPVHLARGHSHSTVAEWLDTHMPSSFHTYNNVHEMHNAWKNDELLVDIPEELDA